MMQRSTQVCLAVPMSKDRFQKKLAAAWSRIWPVIGKGTMADRMGLTDTKTIDRGVAATNLPEAHTIFNALVADPTALDEILAEYGFRIAPLHADAANDMITVAGLCDAAHELAAAVSDGFRDHQETMRVADKVRPHMPALEAIILDADVIRGGKS
jgi:hypothetical protein